MKKGAALRVCKFVKSTGIARFCPRVILNFIYKNLKSDFAIVQGHKMFLDSGDNLNLSVNQIYEEYQTEIMKEEISEGDVVLDIGANIGYFTLIFAKLVGKNGKVFAFEPDPTNFALLKKNVEINGYKNVILIDKAASNKTGKIKLYLCKTNKGDHRIYNSYDGRDFIEIQSIRLDDYFKNRNEQIDLIKIDIQGAEWRAVMGMRDLLKKNKNIKFISEFWPMGLSKSGVGPLEYLKLLLEQGFEIKEIHSSKKEIIPVNTVNLLKTYTIENEKFTDLFCSHIIQNK